MSIQIKQKNEGVLPYEKKVAIGTKNKNDIEDINPHIKKCTIEESVASIRKCIKLYKENLWN